MRTLTLSFNNNTSVYEKKIQTTLFNALNDIEYFSTLDLCYPDIREGFTIQLLPEIKMSINDFWGQDELVFSISWLGFAIKFRHEFLGEPSSEEEE